MLSRRSYLPECEARGQAEGLRQALLRQLGHRFGAVPKDVVLAKRNA
jgi:hypothetical protein